MKRFLRFFIFFFIGSAVFLIVLNKIGFGHFNQAMGLFLSWQGLVIILFALLFVFLGVLKWKFILKSQGYVFSFRQLSPLWLICFSISYLTPFAILGGEIFRIYFTQKKLPQLPREKNISSVAIDKLLDTTVFFVFLIIGVLVFSFYGRFPTSFFGVSAIIVAGAFLALLLFFYFKRFKKQSIVEWFLQKFSINKERLVNGKNGPSILEAEKDVFAFFSLKKKAFWQALSLTVARYLGQILRCFLLIFFLTGSLSFLKTIAAYGFTELASLTPLPATLGALELSQGLAFSGLGFGFNLGAVFSIIWRNADLLLCLFGLIFVVKFSSLLIENKVSKMLNKQRPDL